MHNLCVFWLFFSKIFFTEDYFLIAAIKLTILGPLYTCLVVCISTPSCVSLDFEMDFWGDSGGFLDEDEGGFGETAENESVSLSI